MKTPTVLLAAGESWESTVLATADQAHVVVLKRCVDLTDLLATATLGQATVAVVSANVPRLDAEAVQLLRRHGLAVIAVGAREHTDRVARLGATCLVEADPPGILAAVSEVVARRNELRVPEPVGAAESFAGVRGRTIAVWGPAGAPGRTTLALGMAAELAAVGRRAVLVDADPYGGCVAARLGILDEASGLLTVARRRNAGTLDRDGFAGACRRAAANLDVLTGLPRADRRIEVRPEAMTGILEIAAEVGDVVVDTGFSIEDGDRDRMTVEALAVADEIVVVGQADPVGLARLARALTDLDEHLDGAGPPVRLVLNRFRPGHGWQLDEVSAFLRTYVAPLGVRAVPEDSGTLDRSASSGRTLVELGASAVRVAIAQLAADCYPEAFEQVTPKRRRAGTVRRRSSRASR